MKELDGSPNFQAIGGFKIIHEEDEIKSTAPEDLKESFKKILLELTNSHKEFPLYMIEFMAENQNLSQTDIKLLVREFRRKKILVKSEDQLFKVNFNLLSSNLFYLSQK